MSLPSSLLLPEEEEDESSDSSLSPEEFELDSLSFSPEEFVSFSSVVDDVESVWSVVVVVVVVSVFTTSDDSAPDASDYILMSITSSLFNDWVILFWGVKEKLLTDIKRAKNNTRNCLYSFDFIV